MAKPRMIQGQFGTTFFDGGLLDVNTALPINPLFPPSVNYLTGRGILSTDRRNDELYQTTTGDTVFSNHHYMQYQYIDLRDLIRENACMDDVTINIQRLRETPLLSKGWNLPPGNGVEEVLLFVLGDLSLDTNKDLYIPDFAKAAFGPTDYEPFVSGTAFNGSSLPFTVLFREIRRYMPDLSQTVSSPNAIGSYAGAAGDATQATTTFCGRLNLTQRTVGGYPDLLVGPGITVIRLVSCYLNDRSIQNVSGGGPTDAIAKQFQYLMSDVSFTMPAFQYNIVGTQRDMTATEIATYYSNILTNSND